MHSSSASVGVVTASVDHIQACRPFVASGDVLLQGLVVWTGTSSAKVRVEILQAEEECVTGDHGLTVVNRFVPVMESSFTLVALDKVTGTGARIPSVKPETDQEKMWFDMAEARHQKIKEKRRQKKDLEELPELDSDVEQNAICNYHTSKDGKLIPIFDTMMESNILMFPQSRNINNKIFGGYLMRKSFELAFMSAVKHSGGKRPRFEASADINFLKVSFENPLMCLMLRLMASQGIRFLFLQPVDIGSILNLKSFVSYATERHAQIAVVANILKAGSGDVRTTNTFHYSFEIETGITVIPTNRDEEKIHLESKKRHKRQKEIELKKREKQVPVGFRFFFFCV